MVEDDLEPRGSDATGHQRYPEIEDQAGLPRKVQVLRGHATSLICAFSSTALIWAKAPCRPPWRRGARRPRSGWRSRSKRTRRAGAASVYALTFVDWIGFAHG